MSYKNLSNSIVREQDLLNKCQIVRGRKFIQALRNGFKVMSPVILHPTIVLLNIEFIAVVQCIIVRLLQECHSKN
jgi:cellobiose-specific phosphotransferase system component IIC